MTLKSTEKLKRMLVILAALAVFVAPLAYAQSDIFIGAKKDKDSQSSAESKRPSVFITPGDQKKSDIKRPFIGKNVFRSDSRLNVYSGVARAGAKLVMPNMDMRGNKTPTKDDLLMMVKANRQTDFAIMQKDSALKLQNMRKNKALRDKDKHKSAGQKKVAVNTKATAKKNTAKKEQDKKRAEKQKKKTQIFVTNNKKKKSSDGKPPRIFNTYD